MNSFTSIRLIPALLATALLWAGGTATTANAATLNTTTLSPRVDMRPLTPQELKNYSLTNTTTSQSASGLSTVPVNKPAYLDALVSGSFPDSNIVSVTWSLTSRPIGSAAALTNSPLGTNVPPFKMTDQVINSFGFPAAKVPVGGRAMLMPDIVGRYLVNVSITNLVWTTNNPSTSSTKSTNLTLTLTAGTYLGAGVCAYCHSGSEVLANIYTPWSETPHATAFTRKIDGIGVTSFGKNCISCHVVGYDSNTNSANGGFDDVWAQTGWVLPTVLTNGNWAAMPTTLQAVANIQCENCHGPGSQHIVSEGKIGNTNYISKSFISGECSQCHDSLSHHTKTAEWNNSSHAVIGNHTGLACVRCHTAPGFVRYTGFLGTTNSYNTNGASTVFEAITCAACHDPHDASKPEQLRVGQTVNLDNGTSVTNAGLGSLCMNCHQSRTGSYTNSLVKYPLGIPTYVGGSSSFGPHANPAADMLEGVNGYTYDTVIPSSAHRTAVTNTCVGCHMQTMALVSGLPVAGGHTMKMSYDTVSGGVTNTEHMVSACAQCHGPITSFDMVRQDYNGDGVIEGVQIEVVKLYDKLSTLLPNSTYQANPSNYVADGLVKSPSTKTNWPAKFLQATWNYQLVKNDLSKGIHNAPYAVGLLRASIGNLTGDSNNDGIADWWQIKYFGSNWTTNALASPYAAPAGDGVPNWLKYNSGLDPFVAGTPTTSGYVFGPSLVNPAVTNEVEIYTAAEVVFNTTLNTAYQIQSSSSLESSGVWQNVGGSILGTGGSISYVTPARGTNLMFFRVGHTP